MSMFGLAKGLGSLALGGGIRRLGTGMAVGGVAGALSSDSNTPTGKFYDAMQGAALGGIIGGLTTKTALNAMFRNPWQRTKGLAKLGYGTASTGLKLGAAAGGFAIRHPGITTLAAGTALAGGALMTSGPSGGSSSPEALAIMAAKNNSSSTGFALGMAANPRQAAKEMFMESAFGLVQGLHRGRH